MKKFLRLTILTIAAILVLSSCQTTPTEYKIPPDGYEALQSEIHYNQAGANHNKDIKIYSKENKENKLFNSRPLTVNGYKVMGTYSTSYDYYIDDKAYGGVDIYKYDNGTVSGNFCVDKKTFKVCGIYFYEDKSQLPTPTDTNIKSHNECLLEAYKLLSQYVDDPFSYVADTHVVGGNDSIHDRYTFTFTRKIGGLLTDDELEVTVSATGKITRFDFSSLGHMRDVEAPDSETMDAIKTCVDNKAETIYAHLREENTVHLLRKDYSAKIIKLYDGKLAIEYHVNAQVIPNDNAKEYMQDGCVFIIYLE